MGCLKGVVFLREKLICKGERIVVCRRKNKVASKFCYVIIIFVAAGLFQVFLILVDMEDLVVVWFCW